MEPLTGREYFAQDQTQDRVTHRIVMRWYDGRTPSDRFKWGSRTFGIESVRNIEEIDRMTELFVVEEV